VRLINDSKITLGGAANVALNLTSLGVSTKLIGICGNDGSYFSLNKLLGNSGIDYALIIDYNRKTTTKTRVYEDEHYLFRIDDEYVKKINESISKKILEEFYKKVKDIDAVILSDYNKGFFTESLSSEIIRYCKNIPIIVDFKPANKHYFKDVDIISPNYKEAKEIQPSFDLNNIEEEIKRLYFDLKSKNLIVTLGSKGMCGYDGSSFFHIPAEKVDVRDEVGCGDTVRAILAIGHSLGLSLKDSAKLANYAASVVIQKLGTATINKNELIEIIGKTSPLL
jgi:D-beta-D-heptose 7-phosphate kinase/D-beta-D-heptose 1-phosphate adenosyltransferase